MRVVILGAGPAGLYAAYLLKKKRLATDIRVIEQNPANATFGFGVVFSDRALEFLNVDDPQTHEAITCGMESWRDITLNIDGYRIVLDGIGFSAIGRLELLQLLQQRAAKLDIEVVYNHRIGHVEELGDFDVLIGADGVNSMVRGWGNFGSTQPLLTNRFAWYGTAKRFETLTQTFRSNATGHYNAHHYRYSPDMSTFIAEVDEKTFFSAGFDRMNAQATKACLEEVFAEVLEGEKLIENKSDWRQFPKIHNQRWSSGKMVLVGDALHTAHYSIGSGTRLALEDVIALVRGLEKFPDDIGSAFAEYEAARRPIAQKIVEAANKSAGWYENFADHMRLDPWEMAFDYLTRSARINRERLLDLSPDFVAAYRDNTGRDIR